MAAASKNFLIEAGADFSAVLVWKLSDGSVKDLTGYTAEMHARAQEDSDEIFLELSTSNGRISIDGPNGEITLSVTAADTSSLDACETVYDLFLTSGGGATTKLLKGTITIDAAVTR